MSMRHLRRKAGKGLVAVYNARPARPRSPASNGECLDNAVRWQTASFAGRVPSSMGEK
jgi:hypothetical protein